VREIWADNKKFILLAAGSVALMLVFLWLCLSSIQRSGAVDAENRTRKQELMGRIRALTDEESENAALKKKLAGEILPRMSDTIELRETLEKTPADTGSEGFIKEIVRKEIEELRKSALKRGINIPYPSSSGGSKSYWSTWALPDVVKFTPERSKELRTRIFATSGVIVRAIDSGVSDIAVRKQGPQTETAITGSSKVILKTPVTVEVSGPYDRVLDFLGRVQQKGFYLQVSDGKIERGGRDGEIRATLTLSALAYESPAAPAKASRTSRSGSYQRRDNDY
jgi:hypothetical protein